MILAALRNFPGIAVSVLFLCACTAIGNDDSAPRKEIAEDTRMRENEVRENMRRTQLAAEHYAGDHGFDRYPIQIDDDFKTYFPGGREGAVPSPIGLVNVFTGANCFPTLGKLKDLHSVRYGKRFAIQPGEVIYSPLDGKGYLIVGGAADGKVLEDDKNPGQVLVFSNLED